MAAPFDTARFTIAPALYTFKASIERGPVDSVVFYRDGFIRLGAGIISIAGDTASLDWTPPTTDDVYKVYAKYYTTVNGLRMPLKTTFTTLIVDDGDPNTNDPRNVVVSLGTAQRTASRLSVFPNPGNGRFTLLQTGMQVTAVHLLDLTGRSIATQAPAADHTVDFSGVTPGTYMLRCLSDRQVTVVRVVVR
jgi:hypothetical protein